MYIVHRTEELVLSVVDMVFPADLKVADGDYFNGRDRYSYGTMRWERII